jgi:t-SNARE complex subunit (syntaxin)
MGRIADFNNSYNTANFLSEIDKAMMDSEQWHEAHKRLLNELSKHSPRDLKRALEYLKKN